MQNSFGIWKIIGSLLAGVVIIILIIAGLRVYNNVQVANNEIQEDAPMERVDVDLAPQSGSNQTAQAVLLNLDGKTKITVNAKNSTTTQPVSLRSGTCDNLGAISYKLNDLVGGVSDTTIAPAMHFLHGLGDLSITIHKSAQETGVTMACANLKPAFDQEMQQPN